MITFARGIVLSAFLTCTAVGLACPASADPLSGTYHLGGIDDPAQFVGSEWTLTPCGSDCLDIQTGSGPVVAQTQGADTWVGPYDNGCVLTLNSQSLIASLNCGGVLGDMGRLYKTG